MDFMVQTFFGTLYGHILPSELKEMLAFYGFYCPNIFFRNVIWSYIAPLSNFMSFWNYLCIIIII
jgi:hypothetical protein